MNEAIFSYAPVTKSTVSDLLAMLGKSGVSISEEKVRAYSRDEVASHLWSRSYAAEVVCFPESAEEVSALLKYANRERIPVTPRGAGTGLSGGAVPAYRGIALSLERMNRILELDCDNLCITVEPGVVTSEISKAAASANLMYAGDPCSGDASFIGGNVAENAGGNKVVKYGATGSSVLGLEVVLPDGSITWFGGKRRKDVTGYDFVHLIAGSEGTLGVITKIILRLQPKPAYTTALLVPYKDVTTAILTVPKVVTEGRSTPSSIEFIDGASIRLAEAYLNTSFPFSKEAEAYLILEYEENDREYLSDLVEKVGDICMELGALEVFVADNRTSRDRLWKCRKSLAEAVWAHESVQLSNEDIVVPCSRVSDLMDELKAIGDEYGTLYAVYGHLGDGNIHITFYLPGENDGWREILENVRMQLYKLVKDLGGTLTGEHGVGLKRIQYVPIFLDDAQIELIKRVKLAFDPANILNPGKIVPWREEDIG